MSPPPGANDVPSLHHHLFQLVSGNIDPGGLHEFFGVEGFVTAEETPEGVLHPLFVTKAGVVARVSDIPPRYKGELSAHDDFANGLFPASVAMLTRLVNPGVMRGHL